MNYLVNISQRNHNLYIGKKRCFSHTNEIKKINLCTNKLLYMNMLYRRKKKATSISFIKQNQEENWCMESNLPEKWMPR